MIGSKSVQEQIQNLQFVYQEYEELNKNVEDQYSQQVINSQQAEKRFQQLNQRKDFLSSQITDTIGKINEQMQKNIKIRADQLEIVKSKLQQKNKNAQIITQNQYFYKIPKLQFDLSSIEVPKGINCLAKQFETQFQNQKSTLQSQITKLKILIKLSQMNKQDSIKKTSKKQKHQ